jgi:hypothetical protein
MSLQTIFSAKIFLRRIFFVLTIAWLSSYTLFSQGFWAPGYPTVTNISAANGDLNLCLTSLTDTVTVYWAYWRYPANGNPADIKDWSDGPFDGNLLGGGSLTLDSSDEGSIITRVFSPCPKDQLFYSSLSLNRNTLGSLTDGGLF